MTLFYFLGEVKSMVIVFVLSVSKSVCQKVTNPAIGLNQLKKWV